MELIVCESLSQWQLAGVWRLLQVYGEEFVPPLSQRRSTCQQTLHGGDAPSTEGPRAYFEEMKRQHFIAAYRRHGLAQGFYHRLMALYPRFRRLISTRTWSGNSNHISLLQKLAFTGPVRIPDDRGPGIDTVYYYTLLGEGQK